MTTIAYDGYTLAADKQTTFGARRGMTCKLHRIGDSIAAGCGTTVETLEMVQWIKNGADPKEFPPQARNPEKCPSVLVIRPDGQILQYESTPYPIEIHSEKWAIGSGAEYALAAMHLGRSAKEAVELAMVFDPNTGIGVDTMTLSVVA